eukprot:gene26882-4491_t
MTTEPMESEIPLPHIPDDATPAQALMAALGYLRQTVTHDVDAAVRAALPRVPASPDTNRVSGGGSGKASELTDYRSRRMIYGAPRIPPPMPWSGDNAKEAHASAWWNTLENYARLYDHDMIDALPNFFSGKASNWYTQLCVAFPRLTWEETRMKFLDVYDPYHEHKADNMRERLLSNKVQMTSTVTIYAQIFQTSVREAGGMGEMDQIILFRKGLTAPIELKCRTDTVGNPFKSVSQIIQHAMAMERQIVGASNISDELSVAQIERNELSAAQMQRQKSQQWQSRDRNGNGKRPAFPPPPHANMKREKQTHLSWVTAKGWTGPNNRPHTQETIDRATANDLCFRSLPGPPLPGPPLPGPPPPCPPPLEILTANAACLLAPEDSAYFSARLSGCEGRVLIDSGACSVFVNQKYLIANGIATFEGTPVKVRVADGSLAITNLRCDFVLDLGQHRSRVRAYVLPDLGSDDTAALLGRSWMKQAGCMVGYEGPRLRACMHTLKRGTVSIDSDRIPSVPHSSLELVTYCLARVADASTTPGLLSIKKLRKLLRRTRDLNAFEVTVRFPRRG